MSAGPLSRFLMRSSASSFQVESAYAKRVAAAACAPYATLCLWTGHMAQVQAVCTQTRRGHHHKEIAWATRLLATRFGNGVACRKHCTCATAAAYFVLTPMHICFITLHPWARTAPPHRLIRTLALVVCLVSEAHESTDPQRIALLLNVRSIVNITLVCTEGGKACALAPRQMIYTGETTFGNILPHDVSSGSTRRHPSAIGSLPPLRERCVDMRVLEGDVPVGRISEATESTVDSEISLLLADRGGGLGELNEINSWRVPTAEHLIRTVGGDPFLIAAINSHKDLGWEAGEAQYLNGAPLVQLQHTLGLKGLHSLPVNGIAMGSRKARQDRHGRRRPLRALISMASRCPYTLTRESAGRNAPSRSAASRIKGRAAHAGPRRQLQHWRIASASPPMVLSGRGSRRRPW